MGKDRKKNALTKVTKSEVVNVKSSKLMIFAGCTLPDIFKNFEDENDEFFPGAVLHTLATVYVILIMLQLRLSTNANNTTVDGSASFKLYKRKIISNLPGRVLCAMIAISRALPFMIVEANVSKTDPPDSAMLNNLVHSYSDTTFPNHKKVVTPNQGNWPSYLSGELTSMLGILLSCPASNIKKFNLKPEAITDIENPSQILTLIGVSQEFLAKHGIAESDTDSAVFELIKSTMNQTEGGLPAEIQEIEDPVDMSSKLEAKWIGLTRTSSARATSSPAKSSDFVKNVLPNLSQGDQAAYSSAKALGNKSLISNLEAIFAKKLGGGGTSS